MIISSIQGQDNINKCMTNSMIATIAAMANEGIITNEQGINFIDTHVCLMVDNEGPWYKIRKFLKWPTEKDDSFRPVVFKVSQLPE